MTRRLAIAIWWFGVVVGVGGAVTGLGLGAVEVLVHHEEPWVFLGYLVGALWSLVTAVVFMGISFVLGGSFWKPSPDGVRPLYAVAWSVGSTGCRTATSL